MKKKNGIVHAFIALLVGLIFITVLGYLLLGEHGLINKEKQEYDDTHIEEVQEREYNKNVTKVKK